MKMRGCSSYLLRVKNAVVIPLSVFSFKKSTAGACVGIEPKNVAGDVLCKN